MNGGLIPYRYAKALYKFCLDSGNAQQVYKQMLNVVRAFEENPDFLKVLSNPFVSKEDKSKLLLSAAGSDSCKDYQGFVRLITDNKREEFAYEMALAYRDIFRKAHNISIVRITTARTLPESEMQKLRSLIEKAFPGRTLEFSSRINESIIGGFILDVDQVRMDASLSNELEKLRLKLLSSK